MSEPFIGQVKMFAGNFAPRSYAFCDGSLLSIAQNTALFSILGTTYGGDGRTTFGLPDLRGRAPVSAGQGPGLSFRQWGEKGGTENVTLTAATIPSHNHALRAVGSNSTTQAPAGNALATTPVSMGRGRTTVGTKPYAAAANLVAMPDDAMSETGGNQAHGNVQPRIAVNYIIALVGVFPSRN